MYDRMDAAIAFQGESSWMVTGSLLSVVKETLAETPASMMSSLRVGVNIQ